MSVLGSEVEWEPSPTTQFTIFRNPMHYQSQPQAENVRSYKYGAFEQLTIAYLLEQDFFVSTQSFCSLLCFYRRFNSYD